MKPGGMAQEEGQHTAARGNKRTGAMAGLTSEPQGASVNPRGGLVIQGLLEAFQEGALVQ